MNSKTIKTLKTHFLRIAHTKRDVFTLSEMLLLSYYLLNTLHFNFLSWHLHWSGKTEGIPLPPCAVFPPRGGGLINVTMLSGPAEYIYLVLAEWRPQRQECA